jgi:penicillin-insensitive murein endopeptidase
VRAARQVARAHPGATLGVADLSRRGGGESPEHRSHHTGRDADLHFFSVDDAGKPLPPPSIVMERYGANGVALPSEVPPPVGETVVAGPTRRFDAQRNWMLVRALIEDPVADVQWLFVASSLEERMLAYAQAAGEPPWLITQASEVMHQPLDSAGHNDHLHVRVYCSPDDRAQGCVDRGPSRWYKKLLKYDRPLVASSRTGTGAAAAALRTWWPGASSAWPF